MENIKENDKSKARSAPGNTIRKNKNQLPLGFEDMNFEQLREPYHERENVEFNRNSGNNPDGMANRSDN